MASIERIVRAECEASGPPPSRSMSATTVPPHRHDADVKPLVTPSVRSSTSGPTGSSHRTGSPPPMGLSRSSPNASGALQPTGARRLHRRAEGVPTPQPGLAPAMQPACGRAPRPPSPRSCPTSGWTRDDDRLNDDNGRPPAPDKVPTRHRSCCGASSWRCWTFWAVSPVPPGPRTRHDWGQSQASGPLPSSTAASMNLAVVDQPRCSPAFSRPYSVLADGSAGSG